MLARDVPRVSSRAARRRSTAAPIAKEIVAAVQAQGGLSPKRICDGFEPYWEEPVVDRLPRLHGSTARRRRAAASSICRRSSSWNGFDLAGMGQNSADDDPPHRGGDEAGDRRPHRLRRPAAACPTDEIALEEYAAQRRALDRPAPKVGFERGRAVRRPARRPGAIPPGSPAQRHKCRNRTTHFDVIDGEGNAVSVTQSLGDGFGSGVMAGDTGLMLNNFDYWFDSDPDSPNVLGPRKKIEMCMAPAAITHGDGALFGVIGTPGSFGILQTTPQMIMQRDRPRVQHPGRDRGPALPHLRGDHGRDGSAHPEGGPRRADPARPHDPPDRRLVVPGRRRARASWSIPRAGRSTAAPTLAATAFSLGF